MVAGALTVAASVLVWLVMESWFRSRLLPDGRSASRSRFRIFLATGVTRILVMLTGLLMMLGVTLWPFLTVPVGLWSDVWSETRGVTIVGVVVLAALLFAVTLADTLVRANAVPLFGRHMLEVTGIVGTLMFIDACLSLCALIVTVGVMLQTSNAVEFAAAVAAAGVAAFLLTAMRSYLLLVRFFAIDIMRRGVIDV
jgi:hypothetical protein